MFWLITAALALPLKAVGHRGTFTGPTMEWETEVLLPLRGGEGELPLALALPAEMELIQGPQGHIEGIRNEEGELIALSLTDFPDRTERVVFRTRQPFDEQVLTPPLLEGDVLQRVTLEGAFYEPAGGVGVYKHMRYLAQSDVSYIERLQLDRQLDGKAASMEDQPIYLVADTRLAQAGGLYGTVKPLGQRKGSVAWFVGLVFTGLLGFCAIGYRALAKLAKRETVDAYIRAEFHGPSTQAASEMADAGA